MHRHRRGVGGAVFGECGGAGVGYSRVFGVGGDFAVGGGGGESYFVPDFVEPVVDDLLILSGRGLDIPLSLSSRILIHVASHTLSISRIFCLSISIHPSPFHSRIHTAR